jgi:D-alanyl-lipoteichoic acid acyltransferase DltB (MBOAT superfamily)
MLFPTFAFLLFFIVTVAAMAPFQERHRARKVVLLVASYVFYMQWNWRFGFLLFLSSLLTYAAGWGIHRFRTHARWIVAAAVGMHLFVLCAFKYADFLIGAANDGLRATGTAWEAPFPGLILPIGISFFTFHGISYVVDVYRRDVALCRRLDDMLLYVSFFPQLVAGPIVRAAFFLPQLYAERPARLPLGPPLLLVLQGMVKKVIIANYLATGLVDPVFFDPGNAGSLDLLLAAYGYAAQIYCDFSGYSDMAIGIAGLLGYYFPPNFNQPYRSTSFQEFWRRWHISLSSWLRDYLYKPLGGSRHGRVRTIGALMVTMLLGGLWHGAALKFLVWGALHGGALVLERAVVRPFAPAWLCGRAGQVLGGLVVFHLVCLAWILFRADTMDTAVLYVRTMLQMVQAPSVASPLALSLIAVVAAFQFTPPDWAQRLARALVWAPDWTLATTAGIAIAAIDALGPDGVAPFIYFQF